MTHSLDVMDILGISCIGLGLMTAAMAILSTGGADRRGRATGGAAEGFTGAGFADDDVLADGGLAGVDAVGLGGCLVGNGARGGAAAAGEKPLPEGADGVDDCWPRLGDAAAEMVLRGAASVLESTSLWRTDEDGARGAMAEAMVVVNGRCCGRRPWVWWVVGAWAVID